MTAANRNCQTTKYNRNDRVSPGYYQINETIFIGNRCYKEGEVISLRWDDTDAYINNVKNSSARVAQEDVDGVAHTFCKTHKITVLEKKMGRLETLEKKRSRLKDLSYFLDDDDHLLFHKFSMALVFFLYTVVYAMMFPTESYTREEAISFFTGPVTIGFGIALLTLIFLYVLRKALADPIYELAESKSNRGLEKEKGKIEKEIFACGEAMVPVTGRKPLVMKPESKAGNREAQASPVNKVFPELPKVEIHEPEIKLEEFNGLYLYRTFWKGKKSRDRASKRNRKDKKIS